MAGLISLRQMLHLFELAPGIRIQPAILGENMQRFQQRHRLARPKLAGFIFHFDQPDNAWVTP